MEKNKTDESVLVSVCVLTYNSSAYLVETLESIKNQTYPCLELIVSDDGSTDATPAVCTAWLAGNRSRFVRTEFITVAENTGIPANCNRAVRAARGEWIKEIAGDDLLLPGCIDDCLSAVRERTRILVGRIQTFYVNRDGKKVFAGVLPRKEHERFFQLPAGRQHRYLLMNGFNFSPSVFIRRSVFDRCGYYDERFRYLEDLPYWLRVTAAGIRFEFLPCPTVLYRTGHSSMVFGGDRFFNVHFTDCLFDFREQAVYPEVSRRHFVFYQSEWIERVRYRVIAGFLGNKRTWWTACAYRLLSACSLRAWRNGLNRYFHR